MNLNSQSSKKTYLFSFKNKNKIKIKSEKYEMISIRILDALGVVREVINNKTSDSEILVGSKLYPGTYFAEIIKGKERKIIKLIKLN